MASYTSSDAKPKTVGVCMEGNHEYKAPTKEAEACEETNKVVDPHMMTVTHPTTYWETLFHLIKGSAGSGMFAMGDAFKNAGLLAGPVLTIVLSIICVYGNHVLARCSLDLGRRRKLSRYPMYPDTVELAFQEGPPSFRRHSKTMRIVVEIFLSVAQLGFCSIYFLIISSSLHKILSEYGVYLGVHVWMVIIFIPMVSTAMIRSLKYLVPFSVLANFLTIIAVFLTLYLSMDELPSISSRPAVRDVTRIPLFFGTVVYCFESIGLVLPLQSEMRQPEKFGGWKGVLTVGMTVYVFMLTCLGFVGYLKYGEDVEGSLTHNLPSGSTFSVIVQSTLAIGLVFSYALQFHVAAITIWPEFNRKAGPFKRPVLVELGLRLCLALLTFLAAEVVPMLGLLISLLGSVGSTALVLVFPPLCDLAMHWGRSPGPHYLFDALSILLAVVGFLTGSYCSIRDIVYAFSKL